MIFMMTNCYACWQHTAAGGKAVVCVRVAGDACRQRTSCDFRRIDHLCESYAVSSICWHVRSWPGSCLRGTGVVDPHASGTIQDRSPPVHTVSCRPSIVLIPLVCSRDATNHISVVPGLAKQTSTPRL